MSAATRLNRRRVRDAITADQATIYGAMAGMRTCARVHAGEGERNDFVKNNKIACSKIQLNVRVFNRKRSKLTIGLVQQLAFMNRT